MCRVMQAVCRDLSRSNHEAMIFTPHTTTNVSIVSDANNNAISTEANFMTPPSTLCFLPRRDVR